MLIDLPEIQPRIVWKPESERNRETIHSEEVQSNFWEGGWKERGIAWEKNGNFLILRSPDRSLSRSCSIQDVCRSSSTPCWRCEALPHSFGFYSNMARTGNVWQECLGVQIIGILGSYQISCYLSNALFGGFSTQWSSEQIKLFIDELSFTDNWGAAGQKLQPFPCEEKGNILQLAGAVIGGVDDNRIILV